MNFIETIFESIKKGYKQVMGEIPYDIENYAIGSDGNFEIHENISFTQARKIYKEYKNKLQLGTRKQIRTNGNVILEVWNTLESQSGITYTFMFKVNKIIKHDPNDVINEWNERKQKLNKIDNEIIKELTNTKISTKYKKRTK